MSKLFHLEMITPERRFFDGQVEAVRVPCQDGLMGILAGHEQCVIALDVGQIRLLYDGEWHECASAEGFVEVRPGGTVIFAQSFEWPEEIDISRALAARELAERHIRNQRSREEYLVNKVSLARAMVRLQTGRQRINH
ncbi:MAG: ATP synthase F1 subunit epsilon [Candidatus Fimadaptatus sp.]|jgi:F-type H+-transporting ATPase subunit epsilon